MNLKDFPELRKYIGQELIVTDGNTLLGADDKAGIAAIMHSLRQTAIKIQFEILGHLHKQLLIGFSTSSPSDNQIFGFGARDNLTLFSANCEENSSKLRVPSTSPIRGYDLNRTYFTVALFNKIIIIILNSQDMVFGLHVPGTGRLESAGIPFGATSNTEEFYPNDLGALRRKLIFNRLRGGTAAVILEPVGPESGTRPIEKDFDQKVRELCDEFGALLIFDEVVTGFRLGMGSAQGYFGVKPDLTVFGKCITGGYPMNLFFIILFCLAKIIPNCVNDILVRLQETPASIIFLESTFAFN